MSMSPNPWTLRLALIVTISGFVGSLWSQVPTYKDPSQPIELRVQDLLGRMTLEEKVGQMNMPCVYEGALGDSIEEKMDGCRRFAAGTMVEGLGPGGGFFTLANEILPVDAGRQAEFFNELQDIARQTRLGIPLLQTEEGTHGLMCTDGTVFPEGLALGSTWNMELIEQIYSVAAREARARGIHQLFTLVVEPNRDPRLGRNEEGYSEDPYLSGRIAGAIVRATQGGDISRPDKVVAGLCHYPGQSEPVSGLEKGAMEISERMLREVFLPPWEEGIREYGALGVMATYPSINGEPVHGSKWILTDILRGELQFDGLVLGEGSGLETLVWERVAHDQKEAGALALKAGVDVGISFEPAYMLPLIENVREGRVSMDLIDRAVSRILRMKFRLGLFEGPQVDPKQAAEASHRGEDVSLALQAAREGIVLLKNADGLLPLSSKVQRIAVIGPNADNPRNQLGDYIPNTISHEVVTVLQGIRRRASANTQVSYVKGCEVLGDGLDEIDAARDAARKADVAVVVVGENERFAPGDVGTNGEGRDVASLDLTGRQNELVRAVVETGTPTVVVLVNGRPLSIPWIAENAGAIVEAWNCGEQGGTAVAEVLFGDTNPSGRLAITVPRHVGQLPVYYNHKPTRAMATRRDGYVDLPASPLWEFGFGLSYTSFEYSGLKIEPERGRPAAQVQVEVTVRNTGAVAGSEVVQLYVDDVVSSVTTPVKELRGFQKVRLEPGESQTLTFVLRPRDYALLDRNLKWKVEPGEFEVMVGSSSEDIRQRGRFTVVAD